VASHFVVRTSAWPRAATLVKRIFGTESLEVLNSMVWQKFTMFRRSMVVMIALFLGGIPISVARAQRTSGSVKAVQVTGLVGVKDNTKGSLSVENGSLHFVHGKARSDVNAPCIQNVVTGSDSRKSIGQTAGVISMAAPYGAGRFLSLFRTKIDTLTIEYRDPDGGLHGAIFTMPAGTADVIKKELSAQGASTTDTRDPIAAVDPRSSADKEPKQ
jgi:hypothetical protein